MLPDSMCLDRHVSDFLSCLQSWLRKTQAVGDRSKGYKLHTLDLSGNKLSNANIVKVIELLQHEDVRLERLKIAGNCANEAGMAKITEYVWNCKDAFVEVDLANNEIRADPTGVNPGSDSVSAFLRCFYNHSAYPLLIRGADERVLAVPVTIRLGENFIQSPEKLLKQIRSKGGREHVQIRAGSDPYDHVEKEYLSACMPGFLGQKKIQAQPVLVAPVEQAQAKEKGNKAKRSRSRSQKKHRRRRKAGEGDEAAKAGAAEQSKSASGPVKLQVLTEDDQKSIQRDVDERLVSLEGLTFDKQTREMLAEFAVCMVVAKKGIKEIEDELEAFMGNHIGAFIEWFRTHLEKNYPGILT